MKQKNTKYIVTLGILAMSALLLGPAKPVLAASLTIGDVNSINDKVDELNTIRDDNSISAPEKDVKEFQAQQDILNGVIDLSENEVSSAKDQLNKLPEFNKDSAEQKLQSEYLTNLDTYNAYFESEREKIETAASIDDLKNIASDIKTYRSNGYDDSLQNMVTFTLLYYSSDITTTAKTRLDKITSDIVKLQNAGLVKKSFDASSIDKAAGLISDATKLQEQAKALILEPVQVKDATDITSTDTEAVTKTTDAATTGTDTTIVPPTPRDLIENSINDIKNAYNVFLQISKDVRSALGLK